MGTLSERLTMDEDNTTAEGGATGPDLSHLIAEAEGIEGAQEQAQAQQQAAAEQGQLEASTQALREALGMARMIAKPALAWWADYEACWSDRQLDAISAAGAAVMLRHGVTMGELFEQYGPYIALLGATVPPGLATYSAIKARKAELARPAPPQHAAPPPAPAANPQEGIRL